MHYIKCYSIVILIIPTLFLAGLFSQVSFGAVDKPYIITPTKSICCKNDTNAGSESASASLASPMKKINTDDKKIITPTKSICCKNDTNAGSESTSASLASPMKKISAKPIQSEEEVDSEKTQSTSTSTSASLASPMKKISAKPIQSEEEVDSEKTQSTSTSTSASLASPMKKINTDDKKIITPTKSICCKNDTNAGSESTSASLASPMKKISAKPIQSEEEVDLKHELHEPAEKNNNDRNLSDLIQTNLGKLLSVNSD